MLQQRREFGKDKQAILAEQFRNLIHCAVCIQRWPMVRCLCHGRYGHLSFHVSLLQWWPTNTLRVSLEAMCIHLHSPGDLRVWGEILVWLSALRSVTLSKHRQFLSCNNKKTNWITQNIHMCTHRRITEDCLRKAVPKDLNMQPPYLVWKWGRDFCQAAMGNNGTFGASFVHSQTLSSYTNMKYDQSSLFHAQW